MNRSRSTQRDAGLRCKIQRPGNAFGQPFGVLLPNHALTRPFQIPKNIGSYWI
jgi:hypothetical protein